jgi:hypothetical protein
MHLVCYLRFGGEATAPRVPRPVLHVLGVYINALVARYANSHVQRRPSSGIGMCLDTIPTTMYERDTLTQGFYTIFPKIVTK